MGATEALAAPADEDRFLCPEDQLARQFYAWEIPSRGWQLWDGPVNPEPAFRPFFGYHINVPRGMDDGRNHTLMSGLIDWLHRTLGPGRASSSLPSRPTEDEIDPEPKPWKDPTNLIELQVTLPRDLVVSRELTEQFLLSLCGCRHPVSYELIGLPTSILIQLVCATQDAAHLRQQLQAHFPEISISQSQGGLEEEWTELAGGDTVIAEFGLGREFMLPLALFKNFTIDPLTSLMGAFADVEEGELALLQVLIEPVRHPWAESILRSVTFADGSPLFTGMRDFVGQARRKIAKPLYGVVARIACRSQNEDRVWHLARRLTAALAPLGDPDGNELIPLDNDGYESENHQEDVLLRRSRRSGMVLSSEELAGLVHLPSASIRIPKLRGSGRKTKAAPQTVLGHPLFLGENEHAGETSFVTLSPEQRTRHIHLIGASGTGKSTLLLNMIVQDIQKGDGVAVLDPHGDLIDTVLRHIPPHRAQDVVLIDPADEEFPVGFNVLSAHSALEKNLLSSDLVAVFRRLSTSWGDQMNAVLGNGILAVLESSHGGTLIDLRRFLVEPGFRREFLETVQDPEIVYYWAKEFPLLTGKPQAPVLTRLDTFLRPKPIRYMVAQKESRLDFAKIMDEGKIILARLSHGAIGEENAYLLGTLLVSKLHQMALGRQKQKESDRRHFWLYIDEFQNFATPSMAAILTGARKYRLGLVLAHQELRQLDGRASDVAGAVMANAYTRICFRVGDEDAKKLAGGFTLFEQADLQNLGTGEAICRVEKAEGDFNLRTIPLPAVDEEAAAGAITQIINHPARNTHSLAKRWKRNSSERVPRQSNSPNQHRPERRRKFQSLSSPCPCLRFRSQWWCQNRRRHPSPHQPKPYLLLPFSQSPRHPDVAGRITSTSSN
jgi:hypothetical protein